MMSKKEPSLACVGFKIARLDDDPGIATAAIYIDLKWRSARPPEPRSLPMTLDLLDMLTCMLSLAMSVLNFSIKISLRMRRRKIQIA